MIKNIEHPAGATLTDEGMWGRTPWEFWRSRELPDPARHIYTAAASVALFEFDPDANPWDQKVTITHNDRGREILAGTIEAGESIEGTRDREAVEEGGFIIARASVIGYRCVDNTCAPMPVKYAHLEGVASAVNAYFLAFTDQEELDEPTGTEVVGRDTPTLREIQQESIVDPMELRIIKYGVEEAYVDAGRPLSRDYLWNA